MNEPFEPEDYPELFEFETVETGGGGVHPATVLLLGLAALLFVAGVMFGVWE